jgi:16S rRNA (guanine966-N2)-methyltransferase
MRPHLFDSKILDLFAGQGRLGLSALEEGASHCDFVEISRNSCLEIEKEIKKFSFSAKTHTSDVFQFLAKESTYDIIFADPPFEKWGKELEEKLLRECLTHLDSDGFLILKEPKKYLPSTLFSDYIYIKNTVFGDSQVVYYRKK